MKLIAYLVPPEDALDLNSTLQVVVTGVPREGDAVLTGPVQVIEHDDKPLVESAKQWRKTC